MTIRRRLTDLQRLALFERDGGRCHICEQRIQVGEKWEVEHIVPLALNGKDGDSNLAPAHLNCHLAKTAIDKNRIAKSKRQAAKHIGIKGRSTFRKPPPGFKYDWGRRVYVKETP